MPMVGKIVKQSEGHEERIGAMRVEPNRVESSVVCKSKLRKESIVKIFKVANTVDTLPDIQKFIRATRIRTK